MNTLFLLLMLLILILLHVARIRSTIMIMSRRKTRIL